MQQPSRKVQATEILGGKRREGRWSCRNSQRAMISAMGQLFGDPGTQVAFASSDQSPTFGQVARATRLRLLSNRVVLKVHEPGFS
jgi:hypothetical protein